MSIATTTLRSRRALLGAAIGAAAATVASALRQPAEVHAGTDGDVVLGYYNECGTTTHLSVDDFMNHGTVLDVHAGDGGTALALYGRLQLSLSGRALIPKGWSHFDVLIDNGEVPYGWLQRESLCFANLMSYRPGVFVTHVRPNYPWGKVRIYLNKPLASSAWVAWMVVG
jgi:hypothetical protein